MSLEPEQGTFVFFSYAHQDKWLRDRLEEHLSNLKYRGLITTWHDREIRAGEEWTRQIDIHLNKAQIILLLISSHFMASEYCYSIEMKQALERHERKEADVIPILLRPVLFTDVPFAKLQMLPTNGKPVMRWQDRDTAFVDIARGIEKVAQKYSAIPSIVPSLPSSFPLHLPASSHLPLSKGSASYNSSPSPTQALLSPWVKVFIVVLITLSIISWSQHPPLVGEIVGSLFLLAGILLAILRALVKRAQSKAAQKVEALRRELEEARRREQEQAQRQHYEKALAACEQELHLDNASAAAYRGKGNALVGLERYEEAVAAYEQAIALDASSAPAYAGTSKALWRLGRVQEAEQANAQARQLEEAHRREQQERTYYEEALAAYKQALRQNNTDATAYRGKGNALVGLERYEEAVAAYKQAIDLDPTSATYAGLGSAFAKLQRYDEAVAAYEKAIELDPTVTLNYDDFMQSLLALGREEEAEQAHTRAKQLGYEDDS